MIRQRWILHPETKELVPAEQYVRPRPKRSSFSAPMLIRDDMDPVRSPVDGRMFDSKSALRQQYREGGYIEVGDQWDTGPKLFKPDTEGIRESVDKALSRVGLTE